MSKKSKKGLEPIKFSFRKNIPVPTIDPEYAKIIFGAGVAEFIAELQKQKKEYDEKRKKR